MAVASSKTVGDGLGVLALNTLCGVLLLSPTMRPAGEGGLSRHRADKAELLVTRTHNLREEDTTHHAGPHSGAE